MNTLSFLNKRSKRDLLKIEENFNKAADSEFKSGIIGGVLGAGAGYFVGDQLSPWYDHSEYGASNNIITNNLHKVSTFGGMGVGAAAGIAGGTKLSNVLNKNK